MTLDQRARAAAKDFRQQAHTELDAEVLMSALHPHDTQRTRTNWLAAAGVTVAIIIAIASWLTLTNDPSTNEPINQPNPAPSFSPSPTPSFETLPELPHCGPPVFRQCPSLAGEFETDMGPETYIGPPRWDGHEVTLGLQLDKAAWQVERSFSAYLDLRLASSGKSAVEDAGVLVLAGPYMLRPNAVRLYPYWERRDASEILNWLRSHSQISSGETESVKIDGLHFSKLDTFASAIVHGFTIPTMNPLNCCGRELPVGKGGTTFLVTDEASEWPLVIQIWGDPTVLDAHSQQVDRLIDSFTFSPRVV